MSARLLVLVLLIFLSQASRAERNVRVESSWTIDSKTGTYTNNDTKVSFRKVIASFRLHEAKPVAEDGYATFVYHGERGFITLELIPLVATGYSSLDAFLSAKRHVMEQVNGRFDSARVFAVTYEAHGKRGSGKGVVYHFLATPEFRHLPVYDEFGIVPIGSYLFSYRGSFVMKEGLKDLEPFLTAMGFQRPNQAMQRAVPRSAFNIGITSTSEFRRCALSGAVADLVSR